MAWSAMQKVAVLLGLSLYFGHSAAWAQPDNVPQQNTSAVVEEDFEDVPVESIQQFVQIYQLVKDNYVEKMSDETLFQRAIQGLVSGLDRYSRYLSPEEYQQLVQYTEGDLASVDFTLQYDHRDRQWVIHNLKADADSSKLGLKNGWVVSKIDQQELKNLNQDQVNSLLHGAIGSKVQILVASSSVPFSLVRAQKIEADIQPSLLHNQVLVLKVNVFQQDTGNEIKRMIDDFQTHQKIKAVLLDLRNNPGGLLSAAVETADLFLEQGLIVSTKSRSEGNQEFQALPGNELKNISLGVLINSRSASAAEVFTAAIQDHRRGIVMGEKSYGKGVVQKLFPLPDGSAIQMTVSRYYTPRGKMIDKLGIQPDVVMPLKIEMKEDQYLEQVSEQLLKSIKH